MTPDLPLLDLDGLIRHWKGTGTREGERLAGLPDGALEAACTLPGYILAQLGVLADEQWPTRSAITSSASTDPPPARRFPPGEPIARRPASTCPFRSFQDRGVRDPLARGPLDQIRHLGVTAGATAGRTRPIGEPVHFVRQRAQGRIRTLRGLLRHRHTNTCDMCRRAGPGVPPGRLTGPRASPQNPHNSASAAAIPTENPRTKRHCPAQDGTAAKMALSVLTSLYAGSAGLTPLTARAPPSRTDLLLTGRFQVRVLARELKVLVRESP